MRVLLQEIKKIFNPIRTLAVLAFAVVIFSLYVVGEMNDIFPAANNRLNCGLSILKKFGTTLSADERAVFEKEIIKPSRDGITEIILNDECFKAAGVKNYKELLALEERNVRAELVEMGDTDFENYGYEAYDPKKDYSLNEAEKTLIYQYHETYKYSNMCSLITAMEIGESYLHSYDEVHKETNVNHFEKRWGVTELFNAKEKALCNDLYADGDIYGVMSGVCGKIQNALTAGMFLLIMSLFALMAPVITADNLTGTNLLQAASKTGRRVYKKQFIAMLAAALAFTTLEIASFYGVFYYSTAKEFLSCTLNTFYGFPNSDIYFFRGTLGAYLLCAVVLTYVYIIASTAAIFIVSKSGKHYISLLFKTVPVAAALTIIGCMMLKNLFTFQTDFVDRWSLYAFIQVPFIEVYVSAALFVGLITAVIIILQRNKKRDLPV